MRAGLPWALLALAIGAPLGAAAMSPLLQWRQPIYIAGGFAGIFALSVMLTQPLLAAGAIPGLAGRAGRLAHRIIGGALVLLIVVHVAGLWITSPPDMIDALLFRSPTPFSAWGVIAMVAIFGAALLAALRKRLRLAPRLWRRAHAGLAVVAVVGTVIHAVLIQGAMEPVTKWILCLCLIAATLWAVIHVRIVPIRRGS